ncbi:sigma-54 dependent transcriptional regulator [Chitinophaga sp. CF418]|uniref:sigma-54-dependent transcriptional regulator n=1 Tax=Chitinophaga sp. CF418 TaxID=1855287 RepID=UPI00090EDCB8|nr:sigma-54 dependent transcriptional regulator [Chitinophaga sp. CF418]SHL96812.1 DNA-binding transcriptional response regulator, NtrC family, contains REC, AAA-type ATPase, and a Fis-type DNA-binding domains [Chitinophaga sp. CF418]
MKEKILIVEDQFIEANNLQMILERAGYEVCGIARSVPIATRMLENVTPDLVMLDIFLQGNLTGIDLAKMLKQRGIAFVYLSANSNKETIDAAKATHPYGFLVKPFREKDVLVMLEIAKYMHLNGVDSVLKQKKTVTNTGSRQFGERGAFDKIIGQSQKLQHVFEHVHIVAPFDTSVLILGESGTGKERIAEAIHELSSRCRQTLVKINCAALPATLIESILFGHERGSFTGATERRIGKFEQANHGTIFLDEVGELPLELQLKLLRVLQEKEMERVGGSSVIKVDVRVVAATNRNLEKEVAEGRFRMDLYFRLNVFPITLPPLRDRQEDIPLLANHFIEMSCKRIGKSTYRITDPAIVRLKKYSWPGNVRELEHIIERSVLLSPHGVIEHVPISDGFDENVNTVGKIKTMEENERDHIIDVLKKCNGKLSGKGGAAELLGINASTLNSRIRKLNIQKVKNVFR